MAQGSAFIHGAQLAAFGDSTLLRDPRGRSPRPSLVPAMQADSSGISVEGPFLLVQSFRIRRDQGVRFVEATGDENPIHREGDIVPGAMTTSKLLAGLEILFTNVAWKSLDVRFSDIARYDRPTRSVTFVTPSPEGERIATKTRLLQDGKEIATISVDGETLDPANLPSIPRRKVKVPHLRTVREFFGSLNLSLRAYLHKPEGDDYTYPHAFVASLPSGEMVRRLRGDGGLLNKLSLDLPGTGKIPITGSPEVQIEKGTARLSFQRIFAWIREGLVTYYQGSALVLPGARLAEAAGA